MSCRRKLSHFLVAQGTNHLYDSRGIVARNGQSSRQPASLHFCRPSHLCPFFWLGKKANVLLRLSGWKGPLWASRVVYFVKIWQKIEWAPVHFPRLFCEFWAFLSEDEKRGKIQAWMGFSFFAQGAHILVFLCCLLINNLGIQYLLMQISIRLLGNVSFLKKCEEPFCVPLT